MARNTRTANFKFINQFDTSDPSYCMVGITVVEKTNDSGEYFEIIYTYEFEGSESSRKFTHPLFNKEDSDGVIVRKNAMTEIMVDYLLKEPEELEKVSGSSTAQHYRRCVMESSNILWD